MSKRQWNAVRARICESLAEQALSPTQHDYKKAAMFYGKALQLAPRRMDRARLFARMQEAKFVAGLFKPRAA